MQIKSELLQIKITFFEHLGHDVVFWAVLISVFLLEIADKYLTR